MQLFIEAFIYLITYFITIFINVNLNRIGSFPELSDSAPCRQQFHIFSLYTWIVPAFTTKGLSEWCLSHPGTTWPSPLIVTYHILCYDWFSDVLRGLWCCHTSLSSYTHHILCGCCLCSWNCSTQGYISFQPSRSTWLEWAYVYSRILYTTVTVTKRSSFHQLDIF